MGVSGGTLPSEGNKHYRLIYGARRQDVHSLHVRAVGSCDRAVRACGTRSGRPTPFHAGDEMAVRIERLDAPPCQEVPRPDRLVVRCGEEELAGRVEDERADPIVVWGGCGTSARFNRGWRHYNTYGRPEQGGSARNSDNWMRGAYKGLETLTTCRVPKPDRLVS